MSWRACDYCGQWREYSHHDESLPFRCKSVGKRCSESGNKLVGRLISKRFCGFGVWIAKIVAYRPVEWGSAGVTGLYFGLYLDGTYEAYDIHQLLKFKVRVPNFNQQEDCLVDRSISKKDLSATDIDHLLSRRTGQKPRKQSPTSLNNNEHGSDEAVLSSGNIRSQKNKKQMTHKKTRHEESTSKKMTGKAKAKAQNMDAAALSSGEMRFGKKKKKKKKPIWQVPSHGEKNTKNCFKELWSSTKERERFFFGKSEEGKITERQIHLSPNHLQGDPVYGELINVSKLHVQSWRLNGHEAAHLKPRDIKLLKPKNVSEKLACVLKSPLHLGCFGYDTIIIGRGIAKKGSHLSLRLTHGGISSSHCRIHTSKQESWLVDFSTNGTYVNGTLVGYPKHHPGYLTRHRAHRLKHGDLITFGGMSRTSGCLFAIKFRIFEEKIFMPLPELSHSDMQALRLILRTSAQNVTSSAPPNVSLKQLSDIPVLDVEASSSSSKSSSATPKSTHKTEEDGDVLILSSSGANPLVDFAHARHTCLVHRWQETDDSCRCSNCYCFICDSLALKCTAWQLHCHAFPNAKWRAERVAWKKNEAKRRLEAKAKETKRKKISKDVKWAHNKAVAVYQAQSKNYLSFVRKLLKAKRSQKCECDHKYIANISTDDDSTVEECAFKMLSHYKVDVNPERRSSVSRFMCPETFVCRTCKKEAYPNFFLDKMLSKNSSFNPWHEENLPPILFDKEKYPLNDFIAAAVKKRYNLESKLLRAQVKSYSMLDSDMACLTKWWAKSWVDPELNVCKTCGPQISPDISLTPKKLSDPHREIQRHLGYHAIKLGILPIRAAFANLSQRNYSECPLVFKNKDRALLFSNYQILMTTNKENQRTWAMLGHEFYRHNATCVLTKRYPSSMSLAYMMERDLVHFPFPEDFLGMCSYLYDTRVTLDRRKTGNKIMKSILSTAMKFDEEKRQGPKTRVIFRWEVVDDIPQKPQNNEPISEEVLERLTLQERRRLLFGSGKRMPGRIEDPKIRREYWKASMMVLYVGTIPLSGSEPSPSSVPEKLFFGCITDYFSHDREHVWEKLSKIARYADKTKHLLAFDFNTALAHVELYAGDVVKYTHDSAYAFKSKLPRRQFPQESAILKVLKEHERYKRESVLGEDVDKTFLVNICTTRTDLANTNAVAHRERLILLSVDRHVIPYEHSLRTLNLHMYVLAEDVYSERIHYKPTNCSRVHLATVLRMLSALKLYQSKFVSPTTLPVSVIESAHDYLASEKWHFFVDLLFEYQTAFGIESWSTHNVLKYAQLHKELEWDLKVRHAAQQPPGLNVKLREYQCEALQFMLERERDPLGIHSTTHRRLHGTELKLTQNGDNITLAQGNKCRSIYFNFAVPSWTGSVLGSTKGGIVGQEMGLGKTVESLGLIISNPRPSKEEAVRQMELVANDPTANACHRERIENGALELGGTLVVCKVSLVGQWCDEYRDKLSRPDINVCEYHGSKRKIYHAHPELLGTFDLVVTTYETLGAEFSAAEKRAMAAARQESWVCKHPSPVWNVQAMEEQYVGPPCRYENSCAALECSKCGEARPNENFHSRARELRRTGKIQAPIEGFFWHRIIADESHSLKNETTRMSKAMIMLAARSRWCMTGTPMLSKVSDLRGQLSFLGLKICRDSSDFDLSLCRTFRDYAIRGISAFLSIMLRHRKEQIRNGKPLIELPKKTEVLLPVNIALKDLSPYFDLADITRQSFEQVCPNFFNFSSNTLKVHMLADRLRRVCSGIPEHSNAASNTIGDTNIYGNAKVKVLKSKLDRLSGGSSQQTNIHVLNVLRRDLEDLESSLLTVEKETNRITILQSSLKSKRLSLHRLSLQPAKKNEVLASQLVKDVSNLRRSLENAQERIHIANATIRRGVTTSTHEVLLNSKIKVLLEKIKDIHGEHHDEKALVFSNFAESLRLVQSALTSEGMESVMLTGSMTLKERQRALERYKTEPQISVLLLTMRVGSVGINLTRSNRVFLLEPSFKTALEDQAFARAWRLGQSREVVCYRMYIPLTIEHALLQIKNFLEKDPAVYYAMRHVTHVMSHMPERLVLKEKIMSNSDKTIREPENVGSIRGDKTNLDYKSARQIFGLYPMEYEPLQQPHP